MPRLEFDRVNLQLVIRRKADGGALVSVGMRGALSHFSLPAQTVENWLALSPSAPIPDLLSTLRLDQTLNRWREIIIQRGVQNDAMLRPRRTLARLTLRIEDPALAALDWERSLMSILRDDLSLLGLSLFESSPRLVVADTPYSFSLVRISPVVPRAASIPLTLPVRILHLNAEPEEFINQHVRSVFGGRSDEEVSNVVRMHETTFGEWGVENRPDDWPTIEVLHFVRLPMLARTESLLTTADASIAGTLGWFSRWTDVWQTRLVVIEAHSAEETAAARRLGHALTGLGGPALLVTSSAEPGELDRWRHFYDLLVHDSPHDYSTGAAFGVARAPFSLFAGAGREDAMRFSNIGLGLLRLYEEWMTGVTRDARLSVEVELKEIIERAAAEEGLRGEVPREKVYEVARDMTAQLSQLHTEWKDYWFEDHEREGVLPMAERLNQIRRAARTSPTPRTRTIAPADTTRRYVNSSLWEGDDGGELRRVEQQGGGQLTVGETYHLRIQVGPKDVYVETVGATAIIEEIFKWTPEMEGVWLEVAVSSPDFDVLGQPVQEFWLPREGTSDPIFFAVAPRRERVACLRFSLYFNQNVIQTFTLAALTGQSGEDVSPELGQTRLARALGLPRDAVGRFAYLPKLDYSTASEIQNIMTVPERALSIVANQIGGRKMISIKGLGKFGVRIPNDLKDYVASVRAALKKVSAPPVEGVEEKSWPYVWGLPNAGQNAGKPERLENALKMMAEVGWQLFDRVIPRFSEDGNGQVDQRASLARLLDEERRVIHVAHTLMEDVLPWAALYDRKYDPKKKQEKGKQVEHGVCLAALPTPGGELPFKQCGASPDCLLSEQQKSLRSAQNEPPYVEDTVVCPLHFWGFKHLVEIPAQQVSQSKKGAKEQADCITVENQVQLAVGYNQHFEIYEQHLRELEELTKGTPPPAVWKSKTCKRDDVLEMLQEATLDFVYLYCHAYASREENYFPPFLDFGSSKQPAEITSDQLDYEIPWQHNPLVFLNGCGTAGFNPEAISPFIEKFVQERRAGGVIGTEIPVWEELATEFSRRFLKNFLTGISVGSALLLARRELLAQNNPLGLAYTLYGPTELKLAKGGKCLPGL